MRVVT